MDRERFRLAGREEHSGRPRFIHLELEPKTPSLQVMFAKRLASSQDCLEYSDCRSVIPKSVHQTGTSVNIHADRVTNKVPGS